MRVPIPRTSIKSLLLVAAALLQLLALPGRADTDWSGLVAPEEARAELTALYRGLESAHYDLYANRSRAAYDALFDEQLRSMDAPLTRFQLWQRLQRFTAFGNVAHARIDFPIEVYRAFREDGGRAFPIYLRIVEGRAYVGENYSGSDAVSPGDELLAIDELPMSHWLATTAQYLSADTPYIAHVQLESTFPMYLWLASGERDSYVLSLRKNNNRAMQVTIPALTRDELVARMNAAGEPFSLDYNSREARMLDDRTAYLRPGPFYNVDDPANPWANDAFIEFVDGAFETFIDAGAASLILDLRNNPGGDNSFSDPMIAWIADKPFRFASKFLVRSSDEAADSNRARLAASPGAAEGISARYARAFDVTPRGEIFAFDIPLVQPRDGARFRGDVYVLVNRNSYSNAVNVAAIFQDYGWGTVVGEPTADFATTYGAMEHFALPRTGLKVGFPKALIIRPSGDERPGGVQPDRVIETPIAPTTRDVVLDRLMDAIAAE